MFMYLDKKQKKGIDYYYLRENKRVKGKVVPAFQKYIGNKKRLLEVLQDGLKNKKEIIHADESICLLHGDNDLIRRADRIENAKVYMDRLIGSIF